MSAHNTVQKIEHNGVVVAERGEMMSLTDMWKAAGAEESKRPVEWLRQDSTKEFVECVSASLEVGYAHVQTKRGGRGIGGSTFAHWQIGLAYAKYLDPAFHMKCNQIVRERMEGRQVPAHVAFDDSMKAVIGNIVKNCTGVVIRDALEVILPKLIESDPRAAATEFKPALDLLIEKNVPSRRRRAFSQKVSSRLRRYSTSHGHPMRISRETGRYLFHVDAIGGWMRDEGQGLIASHVAAVSGQGVLPFKKPEAV